MNVRRGLAGGMAAAIALLVSGCQTPPPEGAWLFSPVITIEESGGDRDVTFLISRLSDDTAGGVWAESVGSWLRVAADGTITRFTEDTAARGTVLDIAAVGPTELYVLRSLGSGALNTTVELFDTTSRSTHLVFAGQRVLTSPEPVTPFTPDGPVDATSPLGPLTAIDVDDAGRLVFVERVDLPRQESGGYVVRRLSANGVLETLAGAPDAGGADAAFPSDGEALRGIPLAAASVDVSAGDPQGVVVATEGGVFQILPDGTARIIDGALPADSGRLESGAAGLRQPVRPVDANAAGAVVLPPSTAPVATHPDVVTGGSELFRSILAPQRSSLGGLGLAVHDGGLATSAGLDQARGAVWVGENELVALLPSDRGDESALVRVTLPTTR